MWIGTCTVGYVWRRMYRTLRNYTLCTYLRVLLGGQVVIKVLHLGGTCRYLPYLCKKELCMEVHLLCLSPMDPT